MHSKHSFGQRYGARKVVPIRMVQRLRVSETIAIANNSKRGKNRWYDNVTQDTRFLLVKLGFIF